MKLIVNKNEDGTFSVELEGVPDLEWNNNAPSEFDAMLQAIDDLTFILATRILNDKPGESELEQKLIDKLKSCL